MLILKLLHPFQSVAVQTWRFENKSVIRIGRSRKNEVTLYSAVVSRHHLELRNNGLHWELIDLGSNGTYNQGKRVSRMRVVNGMTVRLASSGPQIQIWTQPTIPVPPPPPIPQAKPTKARISLEELEKARGTFPGGKGSASQGEQGREAAPRQPKISLEELEQAKETQID